MLSHDALVVVADGKKAVLFRNAAKRGIELRGLSVEDVQDALRVQIEGQRAGTVIDGARRIPIVVRGPDTVKLSPAEFAALNITAEDGQTVPLQEVARLEREGGPVKIDREMGSRYSVVIANVAGRDLVGFVEDAKAKGEEPHDHDVPGRE